MKELQWFLDLVSTQNMVDSSVNLGVSQSALSRRLAALESEVGAPLFDRNGRHLALNECGKALARRAQDATNVWQRGVEEVHRLMDPERGTVRLDFMHSLGTWMVPDLVRAYREKHPYVTFQLVQGAAQTLIDHVLAGEADVALVGPKPAAFVDSGELGWKQLATQRLALAVPSTHEWAGRDSVSIAEACDEDFVAMLPGYGTRMLLDELTARAGFRPKLVFESMELTTLAGLVSAGLGVAVLPLGDRNIVIPGMELIPLKEKRERELGMVWRRKASPALAAEAFQEFVSQRPEIRLQEGYPTCGTRRPRHQ
ncbi:LysR family transcriptional regulator [Corynebacterium sp. 4HC-13]|uniref:LysR family transcriptional regulator n=1 Tax=Corynebacterium anserum TaxID=2684406 RepID=UPI001639F843|nr:LysR family transcriptional regulator [Corynebacterium anserum]MBC2681436.1 LysR family transcriptional regulator [Corynebacterium anserum]